MPPLYELIFRLLLNEIVDHGAGALRHGRVLEICGCMSGVDTDTDVPKALAFSLRFRDNM